MRPLLLPMAAAALFAQTRDANPFTSEKDVAEGRRLYGFYCVFCHGMDGASGRGARLASTYRKHGTADKDVYRVIANGVSGTEMSGHFIGEDDIWRIITFVRTLEASVNAKSPACAPTPGDAQRGRALFEGKGACLSCHSASIDGRSKGSGRLGPDLSTAGATFSRDHLRESLVDPAKQVSGRYRLIQVTRRDGASYRGLLMNEDEYTVHLIDMAQNIRSLHKSALTRIDRPRESLMPSYSRWSAAELDDMLAYLCSLGGGAR